MMNSTAIIQKRIWLLRASAVLSVMIAPSPNRWPHLGLIDRKAPEIMSVSLARPSQRFKRSMRELDQWSSPLLREAQRKGEVPVAALAMRRAEGFVNALRRKLPGLRWIRASAGPETRPAPDC